jgi:hypothetical protein
MCIQLFCVADIFRVYERGRTERGGPVSELVFLVFHFLLALIFICYRYKSALKPAKTPLHALKLFPFDNLKNISGLKF